VHTGRVQLLEQTHDHHRDMLTSTIAATLAAVIMMLARLAQFAAFFGGGRSNDDREGRNPLVLLAIALLAPSAALVIQMTISRSREYDANARGAQLVGSPNGLINALRKIDSRSRDRGGPMQYAGPIY
jgi:heat shock protein HtpX